MPARAFRIDQYKYNYDNQSSKMPFKYSVALRSDLFTVVSLQKR